LQADRNRSVILEEDESMDQAQPEANLDMMRSELRARADAVKDAAANSLRSTAENIRQEIGKAKNSEFAQQAEQLARGMEKSAQYLSDNSFEQMNEDVVETVRKNPWRALGLAFFVGLITGIILGNERG
jgi:ElaB/YqjD/DUF883 family membrane-anchored ribosome-binding protein